MVLKDFLANFLILLVFTFKVYPMNLYSPYKQCLAKKA